MRVRAGLAFLVGTLSLLLAGLLAWPSYPEGHSGGSIIPGSVGGKGLPAALPAPVLLAIATGGVLLMVASVAILRRDR